MVPGLKAPAKVTAVSCATPGNCAAVGYYRDRHDHFQVFVVEERHGRWHNAIEIPGTARLNVSIHADARVGSVSCVTQGNCVAGGYYTDGSRHKGPFRHAFVVNETNGRWGKAIEVPGTRNLDILGARTTSVSCPAAGSCIAGGYYTTPFRGYQAFVADETNGHWGKAIEVPGLAAFSPDESRVTSVSCRSPGGCTAGGWYHEHDGDDQPFVVDETNGTWGDAIQVPGIATLNHGDAEVVSVSCAAPANCAAGGTYADASHRGHAFVVEETNGTWGNVIEIRGAASDASVYSVSCATAGNCAAGGQSGHASGLQAFVVNETNGKWGTAIEVPGTAKLASGSAEVNSVSCASAHNCALGGDYFAPVRRHFYSLGFVAEETNARWANATKAPQTAALNIGGWGKVSSVSCPAPGNCTAGGYYTDRHGHAHAFLVSSTQSHAAGG